MTKINFARHFYEGRSKPVSAQKIVNLYAQDEPEDAKNIVSLIGTPGLKDFTTVGDGPIQGIIERGGNLYVVSKNNAYKVDSLKNVTDLGSLGFVSGQVSMAENGSQVLIVKPDGDGYIISSSDVLSQITDVDYQTANTVTFLDTYFVLTKKNSNQYFISAQNDGLTYSATDITSAESDPDNIVAVVAYNQALWVFGEISTEIHYNSANVDFPFEPIQGAKIERGCAAKLSIATEDNSLYWLGDDRIVYAARGYTPVRISNYAIENQINDLGVIDDAFAFVYTQEGHQFYVLTFPNEKKTFVYDITTKLWHQRESFNKSRWRVNAFANVFGKLLVGDFETNQLSELDLSTYKEGTNTIQRKVVSAPVFAEGNRFIIDRLRVDLESGVGLTTGQGSDPEGMLRLSDDGGRTWSYEKWAKIGKIGEHKNRLVWRRLGQSRERVFELTISDPVKTVISGAYVSSRLGRV